jgi:hypothetical protein
MDIQSLSLDMSMQNVQDQAGIKVLGMAVNVANEQSASLARLMESSSPATVTDPALGSNIDLSA